MGFALFYLKLEGAGDGIPVGLIAFVHAYQLGLVAFGVGVACGGLEVEVAEVLVRFVYRELEAIEISSKVCSVVIGAEVEADHTINIGCANGKAKTSGVREIILYRTAGDSCTVIIQIESTVCSVNGISFHFASGHVE